MQTGTVIREFGPWCVVDRGASLYHAQRYVVVDVSTRTAQQVHGPTTKKDAEAYCRVQVGLWRALKEQTP